MGKKNIVNKETENKVEGLNQKTKARYEYVNRSIHRKCPIIGSEYENSNEEELVVRMPGEHIELIMEEYQNLRDRVYRFLGFRKNAKLDLVKVWVIAVNIIKEKKNAMAELESGTMPEWEKAFYLHLNEMCSVAQKIAKDDTDFYILLEELTRGLPYLYYNGIIA